MSTFAQRKKVHSIPCPPPPPPPPSPPPKKWADVVVEHRIVQQSPWIPVSERLPEGYCHVLACFENDCNGTISRVREIGFNPCFGFLKVFGEKDIEITHWMPLPPPPTA